MILTPGRLMRSLCRGWVAQHPGDAGQPIAVLMRRLLRDYAMNAGAHMILAMSGDEVMNFGLIEFNGYHG